jgi:hypothetical protein
MNVFILGLRVTETAQEDEGTLNVLTESLPSNDKRVPTKVQLLQNKDHYVGKLLNDLKKDDTVLAVGPTRPTPDGWLQMQPMLVVSQETNFDDLLAINLFVATGGLGPKADEIELSDTTVTNRSLAWQTDNAETAWFKLTGWGELSKQLSELAPGTPTIAVGRVSTSEKDEKCYLNYNLEKVLYLPKTTKTAPKKAADPEKGKVAAAALGSIDFSL